MSKYAKEDFLSALKREEEIIDYYAGLPSGPGGSWAENLRLAQVRASALRLASRASEEEIVKALLDGRSTGPTDYFVDDARAILHARAILKHLHGE